MRITEQYGRFADRVGTGATGKPSTTTHAAAAAKSEQARTESGILSVSVSGQAAQLSARAARVEDLRSAVREGTFAVDARAIAMSLVGEE